jgi:hypothetical protein
MIPAAADNADQNRERSVMEGSFAMKAAERNTRAKQNAESATMDIVSDLEETIKMRPELALIYCNSALAAVAILLDRYKIEPKVAKEMYADMWQPIVDNAHARAIKRPTGPTSTSPEDA